MQTIVKYANRIRFQRVLLALVGMIQMIYAALAVISAPRTIPALLERDSQLSGGVLAVLFIWSAFRFARSLQPRPSLLLALLPLAVYNALGLWYMLHGEVNLTGIVAHGGVLALSILALASPLYHRLKINLSPLISLGMMIYAVGIAGQPLSGTAGYISQQFTPLAPLLLAILFAMAAGVCFDNHLRPQYLFLAAVPQFIYSLAALGGFLNNPLAVPINGALSHWLLSLVLLVFLFAETERTDGSPAVTG